MVSGIHTCLDAVWELSLPVIKIQAVILSEGSRAGKGTAVATVNPREVLHILKEQAWFINTTSCVGVLLTEPHLTLFLSTLNWLRGFDKSWKCFKKLQRAYEDKICSANSLIYVDAR